MPFVRDCFWDPCGIVCLIFTYLAIFYADFVVIKWIIPYNSFRDSFSGPLHVILFNSIVFLLVMSHLKAVFLDPGTVPLPSSRLDFSDLHSSKSEFEHDEWTICSRCETFRPPRAHHCRICKRCIRRMDHHCPWINNCVGERNQKYFLQFLVYVGLLAIYSVGLIVSSWLGPTDPDISMAEAQAKMLHSVILILESGLFGLFVVAIMFDQLHAILYDETAIEQLQMKGSYRPNRKKLSLMAEVCGTRTHPIFWIFPCTGLNNRKYDEPLLNHDV